MGADRYLTPQQQRFVFAILQGKSQVDAYKAAGYQGGKKADQLASLVASRPSVQEAVARARAQAAEATEITTVDLVKRLENVHDIALKTVPPQTNGAVAALMGIAKLLGLVIDRKEVGVTMHKPALNSTMLELSEEDWKRQFDPHGGQDIRTDKQR